MNISKTEAIENWNEDLARVLIPNDIILIIYIIAGVIGNSLVIFVYGFQINGKQKEERYFIPYLAGNDLIASTICASVAITFNLKQVNFENDNLCKAMWFFSASTTFMSILMLLSIAVNRYRKICRPLGPQMTLKWKRVAMTLAFFISVSMASPTILFYGIVPFPNQDNSLIGSRCSKVKDKNKTGALVYGIALTLVCVAVVISLIVIYMQIGFVIYKHLKFREKFEMQTHINNGERKGPDTCESDSESTNDHTCDTEFSVDGISNVDNASSIGIPDRKQNDKSHDNRQTEHPEENPNEVQTQTDTGNSEKSKSFDKKGNRTLHRFTLIYMLITFIFLICYIPKVILLVIEGLNPYFWEEFSDSERAGVLFVYRMYIINNVSNPIIYGFLDKRFKKILQKRCRCISCK